MSATGLDVFEKTLQTTHIWLGEIMEQHGPDRKVAWHILTVVLRVLRDRLPPEIAAHLGAELPLIVRGAYYDHTGRTTRRTRAPVRSTNFSPGSPKE
ncbi:Uncharacterized conserved protein [Sinorhizobium meliloti]|nr:Uncharacterized conserved protein [Sinorhizobium meliloti]